LKSISQIIELMNKIIDEKGEVVIVIDGMSGSGKSTLAKEINNYFNGNVIHLDDYFLPPNKRDEERLKEPGGNVNYEKFYEDIVLNIKKDLISEPYSCSSGTFKEKKIIKHSKVTIIEGSYSLHPYFKKYYDLAVVLKISDSLQEERLRKREKDNFINFKNKWIPLENYYFSTFNIFSKADLLIEVK